MTTPTLSLEEQRTQPFDQPTRTARLAALDERMKLFGSGALAAPETTPQFVNNHIHTIYSFSPYSPTGAAYFAWLAGLPTAGIMDHDCAAGAEEFVSAGQRIGVATTCGFETRVKMTGSPFAAARTNNPDQKGVSYVACHGIPHQNIQKAQEWLAPVRQFRGKRNAAMVENINSLLAGTGITLNYEKDVLPLSQAADGGSVTERHILYALAFAITAARGKGQPVVDFLQDTFGLAASGKNLTGLQDPATPGYEYVLLGVLKGGLVEKFYIPADDECYDVGEFLAFVKSIGAISAYPYLGDVGDSVTGDKKAQTFEDAYLDELVPWLADAGFTGLTFMPSRNTPAQLARLMALAEAYGLFQISGEDINTPSQSFICPQLQQPEFHHLVTATWALIGHEKAATEDIAKGMFSAETLAAMPALSQRIRHFAEIGRQPG